MLFGKGTGLPSQVEGWCRIVMKVKVTLRFVLIGNG